MLACVFSTSSRAERPPLKQVWFASSCCLSSGRPRGRSRRRPAMTARWPFERGTHMPANTAFHVAVLAGDGIGPEVMAPALEILRKVEAKSGLSFRFTEAPAGANHYKETGKSMPDTTV